jgi:hypothetical protein
MALKKTISERFCYMLFLNGVVMLGAREGSAALGSVTVFFLRNWRGKCPYRLLFIKIQLFLEVQML